ncbi:MAG: hypothetical protein FJX83_05960 [Bacteroidetes bacterium]|nr:hypothetical protein [Bacteroidota bacterium]
MINPQFHHLLPVDFDDQSRVWIYQSNRLLTLSEVVQAEERMTAFVTEWTSHGAAVKGFGTIFYGQFIVLIADESGHGVSGCSTDSSVRFMKELERNLGILLFDRTSLAFVVKDAVQLLPLSQFNYAWQHAFISPDTLYFDNTVQTLSELRSRWLIPVHSSWLMRKLELDRNG